jgi:hypothetical protein
MILILNLDGKKSNVFIVDGCWDENEIIEFLVCG